jgi:hypothetical protein
MDIFYVIVLSVAVVLLIIILTFIGIKMANNKTTEGTNSFPPQYATCPDYWQVNSDGTCAIPASGGRNYGSINPNNPSPVGYDSSKKSINFNASGWAATGTSICNQKAWANSNGVTWDGVSNYNGC